MHLLKLLSAKDFNKANHTYPELVFLKYGSSIIKFYLSALKWSLVIPGQESAPSPFMVT
jgi:hypothetical protein